MKPEKGKQSVCPAHQVLYSGIEILIVFTYMHAIRHEGEDRKK